MLSNDKVIIIGAGNVATHIACALDKYLQVSQVYSHTLDNALILASKLNNCQATDKLSGIDTDAKYVIISVKDHAIEQVVAQLSKMPQSIVMHTSGSVPMDAIATVSPQYGVLYPLQTFTKDATIDMRKVPFFFEGNEEIAELAKVISDKVQYASSQQRAIIHVAAVFACNFTNHLWTIASDILKEHDITFDVLQPLVEMTTGKAFAFGPNNCQTGPAIRGDNNIIAKHLAMLTPEQQKIYTTLTHAISQYYNHEQD